MDNKVNPSVQPSSFPHVEPVRSDSLSSTNGADTAAHQVGVKIVKGDVSIDNHDSVQNLDLDIEEMELDDEDIEALERQIMAMRDKMRSLEDGIADDEVNIIHDTIRATKELALEEEEISKAIEELASEQVETEAEKEEIGLHEEEVKLVVTKQEGKKEVRVDKGASDEVATAAQVEAVDLHKQFENLDAKYAFHFDAINEEFHNAADFVAKYGMNKVNMDDVIHLKSDGKTIQGAEHAIEALKKMIASKDTIILPGLGAAGHIKRDDIILKVMSKEEQTAFKAALTVALQKLEMAKQAPPITEKEKTVKKEKIDEDLSRTPIKDKSTKLGTEDFINRPVDVRSSGLDLETSSIEKIKKQSAEIIKVLEAEAKKRIDFYAKEDLKHEIKNEDIRSDLEVKKGVVAEYLSKMEKELVNSPPKVVETFQKLQRVVTRFEEQLTSLVQRQGIPDSEKQRKIEDYFELVSIATIHVARMDTPSFRVPVSGKVG